MSKLITVFLLLFSIQIFAADNNSKQVLAIMEFEDSSGKLSAKTLSDATNYVRNAFLNSNKYIIVADDKNPKISNPQIKHGAKVSARMILRPRITSFGGKYIATLELMDIQKAVFTSAAKTTFDGSEKSFRLALKNIVSKFFDKNKNSDKPIIAVTDFEDFSGKLSEKTLKNAAQYMQKNIIGLNKYLVTPNELDKRIIVEKKEKSFGKDKNPEYQVFLGEEIPAQTILKTEITSFGETFTITSMLINLEKEVVVIGTKAVFDGSEQSLAAAIDKITMFFEKKNNVDSDKTAIYVKFRDESGKLAEKTLKNARQYIQNTLASSGKYLVIPAEKSIIKSFKEESFKANYDDKLQIQLGKEISSKTAFISTVRPANDGNFSIDSIRLNLETETLEKAWIETFSSDEKSLMEAIDKIVNQTGK